MLDAVSAPAVDASQGAVVGSHCSRSIACALRHAIGWSKGGIETQCEIWVHSGHVLIRRSALRHQPGREGRNKAPRTYGHTAIPADLLMGNYCEQVVHSRYVQLDSSPWPANGRRAHWAAGTVGPVTRGRGTTSTYNAQADSCALKDSLEERVGGDDDATTWSAKLTDFSTSIAPASASVAAYHAVGSNHTRAPIRAQVYSGHT